ncbi:hypothetical protein LMJ43_36990, partial [Streptomyces rochei]|nr:hypothetical protein [Streptomyces rochei]
MKETFRASHTLILISTHEQIDASSRLLRAERNRRCSADIGLLTIYAALSNPPNPSWLTPSH